MSWEWDQAPRSPQPHRMRGTAPVEIWFKPANAVPGALESLSSFLRMTYSQCRWFNSPKRWGRTCGALKYNEYKIFRLNVYKWGKMKSWRFFYDLECF